MRGIPKWASCSMFSVILYILVLYMLVSTSLVFICIITNCYYQKCIIDTPRAEFSQKWHLESSSDQQATKVSSWKLHNHLGVSKNRGVYPPKWMVYFMENPIKMDDLGGFPIFVGTPISRIFKPSLLRYVTQLEWYGWPPTELDVHMET